MAVPKRRVSTTRKAKDVRTGSLELHQLTFVRTVVNPGCRTAPAQLVGHIKSLLPQQNNGGRYRACRSVFYFKPL